MTARIVFAVCFCLMAGRVSATDLDSLLSRNISLVRPYVIINITSTECITCRAGSTNFLNQLSDSQLKKKIIILSDDKNMSLYFRKNQHIYNGYRTIYNKELSAALALGPSATICLFQQSGDHKYLMNKINNDTIAYIKKVLAGEDKSGPAYTRYRVKDSIFSRPTNLFYSGNQAVLFNDQFQVALRFDLTTRITTYSETQYPDTTIEVLNHIISPGIKNLMDAKYAREDLRSSGIDQLTIHGLNPGSNSLLFKQYAVSMVVSNDLSDTNTYYIPEIFIAQKNTGNTSLLNIDPTDAFFRIDQTYYHGDTLDPLFSYGYQVHAGNLFIPYWDIRHSKAKRINGREIKETTCMYIVEYPQYTSGNRSGRAIMKLYDTANGPGNFFFRIDNNNDPAIISETNKTITFLRTNTKLKYSEFTDGYGDTVKKFFDVAFTNDTMWFAGITTYNNCVKGYRQLSTTKISMSKLNTELQYESMRIDGKTILGCKRNDETGELIFDRFSL